MGPDRLSQPPDARGKKQDLASARRSKGVWWWLGVLWVALGHGGCFSLTPPNNNGLEFCYKGSDCPTDSRCLMNVCQRLADRSETANDASAEGAGEGQTAETEPISTAEGEPISTLETDAGERDSDPPEEPASKEEATPEADEAQAGEELVSETELERGPDCGPSNEICDGKDNDCDGAVDEDFPDKGKACTVTGAFGPCMAGTTQCVAGKEECVSQVQPTTEVCDDQIDNDCDGSVDENPPCVCKSGETQACYSGPTNTKDVGECKAGTQMCDSNGQWGACQGDIPPATEQCDNKDNDCNGAVDDGLSNSQSCTPSTVGFCQKGFTGCSAGKTTCEAPKVSTLIDGPGDRDGWVLPCVQSRFYDPKDVIVDSKGNVYVADHENHRIRKIDTKGNVTTFVGQKAGLKDGQGTSASLRKPNGLAIDKNDNIYVADQDNHCIRKIDPAGNVTTFAGTGVSGNTDAQAANSTFNRPHGVALGPNGEMYVADYSNHRIRKIDASGNVTTYAGSTAGFVDGAGTGAKFNGPTDVAVDSAGNVYVSDRYNYRIRKIDTLRNVTTLAGGSSGTKDGTGKGAQFSEPFRLKFDSNGDLLVVDRGTSRIRRVTLAGVVTTVTGSSTGYLDATTTAALFNRPCGLALGPNGALYIADSSNQLVRVLKDGFVHTYAGDKTTGAFLDGRDRCASLRLPYGLTSDSNGNIFIADRRNHRLYRLDTKGRLHLLGGTGTQGSQDGPALEAQFYEPHDLAIDSAGNLYIADTYNHRIRKLTMVQNDTCGTNTNYTGACVTTLAGSSAGFNDAQGTRAKFNYPHGVAVDSAGNVYVADRYNYRIRKIHPAGNVTTLAGSSSGYTDDVGAKAQFREPTGVAVDSAGNVYVADYLNHRIRKIDASGNVTTLAGAGSAGILDGEASTATFTRPWDIALDSMGQLFVSGGASHRIRKLTTIQNGTCGNNNSYSGICVTTVAGSQQGFVDDLDNRARFSTPRGITLDATGNLFIADSGNARLRKLPPCPP